MKDHFFGLVVDGWEMINNVHIEGVMVKAGRNTFLLGTHKEGSSHTGIDIAKHWEEVLLDSKELRPYQNWLKYFVSDDAGQYVRAQRILLLHHPNICWMKCWAHQVNLMVGHLLMSSKFASVSSKAISTAAKICRSSSKWYPRLKDVCARIYGGRYASTVLTVGDTRWNTMQACFALLLRIRSACELFVHEFKNHRDFPKDLNEWMKDDFFLKLEEAEYFVCPSCDASFLMQQEGNTLADVFLMLLLMYEHILDFQGLQEQVQLVTVDINKRWSDAEQPLHILAFALHPSYKDHAVHFISEVESTRGCWPNKPKQKLCAARLSKAAGFYFEKFELSEYPNTEENKKARQREINNLFLLVFKYLKDSPGQPKPIFPYDPEQFDSGVDWYIENKNMEVAFCNLAIFLLDCPVQSASCKWLFNDFALFNTKSRNRLAANRMEKSTLIKHNLKAVYESDNEKRERGRKHIGWKNLHWNRFITPNEHPKKDDEAGGNIRTEDGGGGEDTAEEDNPPTQLEDYNSDDEFVPLLQEQDAMQQGAQRQLAADNDSTMTNEQECHEIQQLLEALRSSLPEKDP
ncbi:hypothetical protein ACA910_016580 [Epithemia clementina (nom. ined.)]